MRVLNPLYWSRVKMEMGLFEFMREVNEAE
jgi:hypothetical protein